MIFKIFLVIYLYKGIVIWPERMEKTACEKYASVMEPKRIILLQVEIDDKYGRLSFEEAYCNGKH